MCSLFRLHSSNWPVIEDDESERIMKQEIVACFAVLPTETPRST
jgi:hypothetical protein